MRRLTHRMTVLAVVSVMVLAMPVAAAAGTDELPGGTDCAVQHVDERGEVTETSAEPEGAVYGAFRCVDGQWEFAWEPFEREDAITTGEILLDPNGTVSVRQFAGPALGYDLTMGEITGIIQAITGSDDEVVIDRAVVAADDGRERTFEEIEALLAGEETDVRVLGVIDRPDAAMSTKDLIDEVGETPESTVVYFSIWGAIKGFFSWVADKIEDAAEWIDEHCFWEPRPLGVAVTCRW